MTSTEFQAWLAAMKAAGRIRREGDAARLLGVRPNTVTDYKQRGTADRRTDLACAALLHGLGPYHSA